MDTTLYMKGNSLYYLRKINSDGSPISDWMFIGHTQDDTTSFTRSVSGGDNVEAEAGIVLFQTSGTKTDQLTLSTFNMKPENFSAQMDGVTIQNGTMFFGGASTQSEYQLMAVGVNKIEGSHYIKLFKRVKCDGSVTLSASSTTEQTLPMVFNILGTSTNDDVSNIAVWFLSPVSDPELVSIPTYNAQAVTLAVTLVSPAEGDTGVEKTAKPQIIFNAPISGRGNIAIVKQSTGELLETVLDVSNTVSGVADSGGSNTTIKHTGDAYPANAFVNAKVRITFAGIGTDERTITAYNSSTKTFTISTGKISSDTSGMAYEIPIGYIKVSPKSEMEASTKYRLIISGCADEVGNILEVPVVSEFTTKA